MARSQALGSVAALLLVASCSDRQRDEDPEVDAGGVGDAGLDAGPDADVLPDASPDSGSETEEPVDPLPISIDQGSSAESESHLVISDDDRLLAVWMSFAPDLENGYALSSDRGVTWSDALTMEGVTTLGDPIAALGPDGAFYHGFLDGRCSAAGCSNGHVWLARLAPGETVFEEPVDISPADPEEFYDKPWLLSGSDGSLIAVFNARIGEYPDNLDRLVIARSSDGSTWSTSFAVPRGAPGQLAGIPHACVSAHGTRLWVVHVDSESPIFASIRWSDDLGATWPAENVSAGFATAGAVGELQSYDLRCVGEGDDVWVMYGLSGTIPDSLTAIPPLDEIHVAHSADGGQTWEEGAVLGAEGLVFLRPEIVLEPSGAIDVLAYAGTEEGDADGAVRWWRSTDGGQTLDSRGVVHEPILFTGERGGLDWVGDYSGFAFDGGSLFATFADTSTGAAHTWFARWSAL